MSDPTVEIVLNSLRWFFLPIDEDVYASVDKSMLTKVKHKHSPIYRGDTYRLKTLHNIDTDLSLLPAPVTGLKGLKAIQKGLHPVEDSPNTVVYTQLSGFDERVHGYKCFGLLFYHPKNKILLDITIQIPEGYEEDSVILDITTFVPHYQNEAQQLKRYIHFRRESWRTLVDDHISRTISSLLDLTCVNKDDKIDFYKKMAKKRVKARKINHKDDLK